MTEHPTALRFNALTDPWLPLLDERGATTWASPVEVLCGERDGIDLDYPRDDFRIFARLLLSALVQALFPARDKAELKQRIETPLPRADVEARIRPVLGDFDLFGPTPFLQITPPPSAPKEGGAAPFVFTKTDLFQPQVRVDAVSLPIALVTLFVEQTYAGGAGRGYGSGPGGQPGAFTLIDPGSVRRAAWANTLALDTPKPRYAPDEPRAWSNEKRSARPRAAIGIVGGLFFQPRGIWLIPAGEGRCSFTGRTFALVRLSPFLPKSELTKKPTRGDDVWQHPCAPLAANSQGIGAIRLNAERPAWTGLAQLLAPLSKAKSRNHPLEGPAPVLTQWKNLGNKKKRPRLLVLDFERDKANVKRRFFEAFPLTDDLLHNKETVERLHALVEDAQTVERSLVHALTRAHDSQKRGGFALADARSSFWSASEAPFHAWLAAVVAVDEGSDGGEAEVERLRRVMAEALRKTASSIFDAHAALSELDPRKQKRIAQARYRLHAELWPRPRPTESTAVARKVST
jgi:CRISPR type I-E-associated protein CasA/Cse1